MALCDNLCAAALTVPARCPRRRNRPNNNRASCRRTLPLASDDFITVDHVTFGYDASRTILSDITASFKRGKVTAIMGGSGCGKTTLLRLIGGVYAPNKGSVTSTAK
jgi:ABC-type bacteriocin/lantibiotic exporter with double-glycine peptidase domain